MFIGNMTSYCVIKEEVIVRDSFYKYKFNFGFRKSNARTQKSLYTTCIAKPLCGQTLGFLVNPLLKIMGDNTTCSSTSSNIRGESKVTTGREEVLFQHNIVNIDSQGGDVE